MPIKFVLKLIACLALASTISLRSAAQQTSPAANTGSSSSAAQPQSSPAQNSNASTPAANPHSTNPQNAGTNAAPSSNSSQTSDQSQASQDKTSPDKSAQDKSTQGKVAGTSNDRLFYTLPNFLTLQGAKQLPPMTAGQKFKVVALGTFDYVQYPWWGLLSAINQADNAEPAYGQGWLAYAKRYGTTAADSTIENFMVGAVVPSLIHQDPRFYQSGDGGFTKRTGYAISRIFVTRTDSGHKQFNYSEIVGSAAAAVVSTYSYHPKSTYLSTPTNPHEFIPSDRTIINTTSVWGTQVALDTITLVIKEFWPDLQRKLQHKHEGPVGSSPPPAPKP